MTKVFTPTERVPSGKFPSAAFCVFSNRFLAVLVALVAVRYKHGGLFRQQQGPALGLHAVRVFEYDEQLEPVRVAQVRLVPGPNGLQKLENYPCDGHGQGSKGHVVPLFAVH
jgi:hypothetical protein